MRRAVIIPGRRSKIVAAVWIIAVMGALTLSVLWQGSAAVISRYQHQHSVVIDAGHGGYDPGAITQQGLYEKEINLQVAKKVADLLAPGVIHVTLTRDEDEDYVPNGLQGKTTKKQTDLNYRISMAAEAKADLFVSLHVNAEAGGQKSGAETFFYEGSASGKKLAETIQQELIKIPGMNRRIAKPADFYVLRNTEMPAVIVELGYLSNPLERKKLQQSWYQAQLAQAVAKGIARYLDE